MSVFADFDHSPLGASSWARAAACTGYFLLYRELVEAGQFEDLGSDYARLGTAAHTLASQCLTEGSEPFEYSGQKIDGFTVGVEGGISVEAVTVYVNHCRKLIEQSGVGAITYIEKSIRVDHLVRGALDFGVIGSKVIHIADFKNGEGVYVSAVNNQQLLYYAYLLSVTSQTMNGMPSSTPVHLTIVQPNYLGVFEEPETWETTLGYVKEWGNGMLRRRYSLENMKGIASSDFVLGDHCQFCPVMLECPKASSAYTSFAEADENEFLAMLSNDEVDAYYGQIEAVQRFSSALKKIAEARLLTGQVLKTAKLVETRTQRVWKPGAEAALKASLGDAAFDPATLKSPAAVEKLSSRGKELATEWGYKPDAHKHSLAPMSDSRPAISGSKNERVFAGFAASQTLEYDL